MDPDVPFRLDYFFVSLDGGILESHISRTGWQRQTRSRSFGTAMLDIRMVFTSHVVRFIGLALCGIEAGKRMQSSKLSAIG